MKHYRHLFSILFLLFCITASCKKDFLDVQDDSVAIRQQYVVDLKTTEEYLNGIYINLAQNLYQAFGTIYPDLVADNIKPTTGGTSLIPHYNWAQIKEQATGYGTNSMNGIWQYGYQIIRSCSFVLEKAEEFQDLNPEKAADLKAQAYGIRALAHFLIVNVYAQPYNYSSDGSHQGVPYVTTSDWTETVTRNTVAEVYNNIINDVNNALPLFNSSTVNLMLMNKNAAKALLARTYLFKGDYLKAKDWAREVGVAVPIMTGSNYPSKLFTTQETEALFQLPPSGRTGDSYTTNFQGRLFTTSSARFLATTDIANLLRQDPQDVRKNWVKSGGAGKDTIVKFPINIVSGISPTSGSYYYTVFRSSEMYLTAAESYAKLNREDSARFYLDAIRKRANPLALATTATGAALLDSINNERRKELAFEGLRMFDLLRNKSGVKRVDAPNPAAQNLAYPSNKAIAPIPMLDVNVLGIDQNPEY
jgi:starch-binding outer membrane protein, SusD/RagB family